MQQVCLFKGEHWSQLGQAVTDRSKYGYGKRYVRYIEESITRLNLLLFKLV
jgi:hypothetical protein